MKDTDHSKPHMVAQCVQTILYATFPGLMALYFIWVTKDKNGIDPDRPHLDPSDEKGCP